MKRLFSCAILVLAVSLSALGLSAQSASNLYMVGGSYNPGASPAFAGSALYAHQIPNGYAFTMIDALPSSTKPFTVTTNIAVGIAQKAFDVAGVPVLIPTAAGVSYSGTNVGWAWSTGAATPFKVKPSADGAWYVMPSVRVVKSSVSGGEGYHPIFGVVFGWGK